MRKPGLVAFGTFNAQDTNWLEVIVPFPNSGGGGGSNLDTFASVPYAPTMVIDVTAATVIYVALNGDVTSTALVASTGLSIGQQVELRILQDNVGGHTWAPPRNMILSSGFAVDPTPNVATVIPLTWNGSNWLLRNFVFGVNGP